MPNVTEPAASAPARYFHCAPMNLGIGSIIQPGNWGRLIRTMYPAPNNNHIQLPYREAVFEYARRVYASDKISRLNCLFVCQTLEVAVAFRDQNQPANIIYEVEPVGDTQGLHVADYNIPNWPQSGQYFDAIFDAARHYWLGENVEHPEVLLPCPAKVTAAPEGARLPPDLPACRVPHPG